jgi:hypothetical protein
LIILFFLLSIASFSGAARGTKPVARPAAPIIAEVHHGA